MSNRLQESQRFPPLQTKTIHGDLISIPDHSVPFVHLQFRRFAGCPICNLHLKEFTARNAEIRSAGIKEVVVFHSADDELLPFQGAFPFAVIGDPNKKLYRRYGISTSLASVLHPTVWPAIFQGLLTRERPSIQISPNGGLLGLTADFLIANNGQVNAVHYGKHADDHWSVEQLLTLAARAPVHRLQSDLVDV